MPDAVHLVRLKPFLELLIWPASSEASPNILELKAFTEDDPRCTSGVHCTLLYTVPATSLYWPQMANAVVYSPILSYYHCGKIMQTFYIQTSTRQKLNLTIRLMSILRMVENIAHYLKMFPIILKKSCGLFATI